ncbi:hypothetical protein CIPAW_02G011800 [Carya illinoinensis]|uniref:Uncharacterized protein n=1 Tax=Carya illinoinensis TaxID=32201 RepID=A0A8T1R7Y2_CARIL|nr:hypothetical protein CIPAW_02G011800 [Carya illinoinensis]
MPCAQKLVSSPSTVLLQKQAIEHDRGVTTFCKSFHGVSTLRKSFRQMDV